MAQTPPDLLPDEAALALAGRLDSLSEAERSSLLEWARRAPLSYGPWRSWKKVFKALDTRALEGRAADAELLAAMLWRVDAFTPNPRGHRWRKVENAGEWRSYNRTAEVRSGTHRFRIGSNLNVSYRCWEVRVSPLDAPQVKGKPDPSAEAVWRYEGGEYFGGFKNARLEGSTLRFEGEYRGVYRVDASDLSFLHVEGDGPSAATWGYVKRRARRLMRKLAARSPELFWQVLKAYSREASAASAAAPAKENKLSLEWSWLAGDLFLGRSPRLIQERRGRGPVKVQGRLFWRRARLERAPEIWDAHRGEARALLLDARTLPEASAVAFNVLREAEGEATLLGAMGEAALERWARGGVAWARALALNEVARRWEAGAGEAPGGEAAARLLVEAGARTRRRAQVLVARALPGASASWKKAFVKPLQAHLDAVPIVQGVEADLGRWPRRSRTAARAMFDLVRDAISDAAFWKYLPLWARFARESREAQGHEGGQAWIEEHVVAAARAGEAERLSDLARVGEAERERLAEAFVRAAQGAPLEWKKARDLLTGGTPASARLAWRLVGASTLAEAPSGLRTLFKQLYERYYDAELGPALFGDEAAPLWARAEWGEKDLQEWLDGTTGGYNWRSPWVRVIGHASGAFFTALLHALASRFGDKMGGRDTVKARYALRAMVYLLPATQAQALEAVRDAAQSFEPDADDLRLSLLESQYYLSPKGHANAWKLLSLTKVSPDLLKANWQRLFSLPIEREAAPAAIDLWKRADIDAAEVAPWLQSRDLSSFAPDFLAFLLRRHPSLLLDSLARAGDDQARALQVLVREMLRDEGQRQAFWGGLFPRLGEEALGPVIQSRLLSDAEIFASFARLPATTAAEFLAKGRGEAEALLVSWLRANEESLGRDDLALLHAAISPLPPVHERGLARLERFGLTLPLALRLWESLLPPAIAAARRWVEARPPGSDEEAEAAIALCDSPSPQVQAEGRAFVEARAKRLLSAAMIARLSEGTHPAMQAWVAGILSQPVDDLEGTPLVPEATQAAQAREAAEFDRAVLRSRGRARAAKEKVKQRLSRSDEAALQPAVLLEMARGRVARDREWALEQIARLAASGVEVPGVEVLGEG